MSEFKQGEMVEVAQTHDFKYPRKVEFISKMGKYFWCIDCESKNLAIGWLYARKIEEPDTKELDANTFPKGITWIKHKERDLPLWQVQTLTSTSIRIGGAWVRYSELKDYVMSVDECKTWKECVVQT